MRYVTPTAHVVTSWAPHSRPWHSLGPGEPLLCAGVPTVQCLHRFCRECIHKCLRLGKKECPACRTHVPSRRSCRPDPAFDRLIRTVYCDPEEFAAKQAAAISATNQRENFNSAYTAGASEAVEAQKKMRKVRCPRAALDPCVPFALPCDDCAGLPAWACSVCHARSVDTPRSPPLAPLARRLQLRLCRHAPHRANARRQCQHRRLSCRSGLGCECPRCVSRGGVVWVCEACVVVVLLTATRRVYGSQMPFFALRRHPSCGTTVPPLTKEHLRASKMLSVRRVCCTGSAVVPT